MEGLGVNPELASSHAAKHGPDLTNAAMQGITRRHVLQVREALQDMPKRRAGKLKGLPLAQAAANSEYVGLKILIDGLHPLR